MPEASRSAGAKRGNVRLVATERLPTAVEVDRLVPLSGNLWIGGQQVWLGPALAGCAVTIRVDESALYVVLDGMQLKTLPSRLGVAETGTPGRPRRPASRAAASPGKCR